MQTYKIIKEGSELLLIVSQILLSLHGLVRQWFDCLGLHFLFLEIFIDAMTEVSNRLEFHINRKCHETTRTL